MAPEERLTKKLERCESHPGALAVARCDKCGRQLCLSCAVPVRGGLLGVECLPAEFGGPATAPPPPATIELRVTGAAFCAAALATLLPWTRSGTFGHTFGAWAWPFRWSMVAAPAALVGCAVWFVGRRRGSYPFLLAGLGALLVVGSVFAIRNPPPFTRFASGAWIALVSGGIALLGSLTGFRRRA